MSAMQPVHWAKDWAGLDEQFNVERFQNLGRCRCQNLGVCPGKLMLVRESELVNNIDRHGCPN